LLNLLACLQQPRQKILHQACGGKARCEPAEIDLRIYPTRLSGDRVEICVAD